MTNGWVDKSDNGGLQIIRKGAWIPEGLKIRMNDWNPRTEFGQMLKDMLYLLPRENQMRWVEKANELLNGVAQWIVMESALSLKVLRHPNSDFLIPGSPIEDYGVVSRGVVTTTGVEQVADTFQSTTASMGLFFWHALGLSSAAEAVGNVGLTNEMTTAGYGSASRTSGTQTTGAAGPHVYETVATITIASVTSGTPMVIQEHGIFKSSAVASTGLWDRSLTGTQTLSTGDQLQTTYDLTISAGG